MERIARKAPGLTLEGHGDLVSLCREREKWVVSEASGLPSIVCPGVRIQEAGARPGGDQIKKVRRSGGIWDFLGQQFTVHGSPFTVPASAVPTCCGEWQKCVQHIGLIHPSLTVSA